jgi:hypothetical protein
MTHQANMEILSASPGKHGWSFYLGWIVFTSLCVPIAYILSILVLKGITSVVGDFIYVNGVQQITEDYLGLYVLVPIVSVLTGTLQYGLLRSSLPRMGWWVLATVAGWLLGVLLITLPGWLRLIDPPLNNLDLMLSLMGLGIGAAQWVLLRRRLARAGWWIAANLLGWGLLGLITRDNSVDQYVLFIMGFLPACATGLTLAFLLNQVPPL